MDKAKSHFTSGAGLRNSSSRPIQQRLRGPERRGRPSMEWLQLLALGIFGEPYLWSSCDIIRNVDVAEFTAISRYATRYEGRSRSPLSSGNQSIDRSRLALHRRRCRIS